MVRRSVSFISLFITVLFSIVIAQPSVTSVSPARNALTVSSSANVQVTFGEAMNSGSFIADSTFNVTGSQSGPHTGNITYNSETNTATFDPDVNFKSGEAVTVTLTAGIKSAGNASITPRSWVFTVASAAVNSFESPEWIVSGGFNTYAIVAADLDGDGDADAAAAKYSDGGVEIMENSGGTFTNSYTAYAEATILSHDIASADIDGDGDLDLVTADFQSHGISVWRNNGSLSFERIAFYETGRNPIALVSGDIDGDGDNDVITANYFAGSVSILKNNGTGVFASAIDSSVGIAPRALVLADTDNDNDLDLVVANEGSRQLSSPTPATGSISLLKNNGNGSFTNLTQTLQTMEFQAGKYPRSIVAADLDNDGDVDIATSNFGSDNVSVLINSGSSFVESEYYATGSLPVDLAAADMDADGDIDLVTVQYGNSLSVLKNNGNGTFAAKTDHDSSPGSSAVAVADVDEDNIMDLILANRGQFLMAGLVKGSSAAPLPVQLMSFTAVSKWRSVELKWNTASEINNYGFEIERTSVENNLKKNAQWKNVGFVEGNGNSNTRKEYSFTENNLPTGKYLYRLKQIDRDGAVQYSKESEISVTNVPDIFILEQNYPNPFNPTTTIGYQIPGNGKVSLILYDAAGREAATLVNEAKEAGYYTVTFDGTKHASGAYFARLTFNGKITTKKVMLLK